MVKNLKKIEIIFIVIVIAIFFILGNKYIINGITKRFKVKEIFNNVKERIIEKFTPEEEIICKENQIKISVKGGDLCRKKVNSEDYKYLKIYDTYPKSAEGKEIIYDFLDEGDIAIADAYLKNEIKIERYNSVKVNKITWEEDPYGERYWRFIFYSLRDTRHLLYAYKETGDERYKDKLIEIIESFIDDGMDKQHAWDDYHGVAFRTMTLVNTWWKLREKNALPPETSEKILKALERHGEFLLEEEHYEKTHNHGISQMAALMILALNFPNINNSGEWFIVAEARLNEGIKILIDDDGILIENSPYYHFYTLEKYWQIFNYILKNNVNIDDEFKKTVKKMISYATYILQPNLEVPLLGASLQRIVGKQGAFKEIAKENSEFLYVLTQGRKGKQPEELNKYYQTAGQVIMRSGWEKKTKFENKFEDQTQVIFDVGPYRTRHSDLDALSFNLYSNGKTLLPDVGLYTYEDKNKLKRYFHGTRGHNTVLVDGQDQRFGAPIPGKFKQGNGYVLHSAQHNLYPQTNHQRSMILLGHDLVLVIDRLISNKKHDYEQLFHLFPETKIEINNTIVIATGENKKEKITIHQLLSDNIELSSVIGDENTGDGFCSFEYEKKVPCYMLSYKQHAKNASFITLLEIGDNSGYISAKIENNKIVLKTKSKIYEIDINELDVKFLEESKLREEIIANYDLKLNRKNDEWQLSGKGADKFKVESENKKLIIIPKNRDEKLIFANRAYYEVNIDNVDSYYSINQNIYTNIPADRENKNFKIYEQEDFLPILGYHHIIKDDQEIKYPTLEMHVSNFEKQVDYMTNKMGCRWFTFGDIMENYVLKNKKIPKRTCIMNFDDGRKDHFTEGYRIFKKYSAVATFYIITENAFANKNSYMNLAELDELYKNGNEIGSHTVSASSLITDGYDQNGLIYQLEESKKMLESQGYKITTFAYPRGEQDQNIIDLTSKFYIAGRDTNKDNHWRDVRPVTISFDKDYIWHMHYHKPELETLEKLERSIGYNSWWQFEEGYRINKNYSDKIRTLSSVKPTDNSFASVFLEKIGDKISNKFIVSKNADYVIEVFGTVNTKNLLKYDSIDTMKIYIDGVWRRINNKIEKECKLYKKQYYCFYNVSVNLKEGSHIISVEANQKNVKVDKFRMYRPMQIQNSYNLKIKELKKIPPREHPNQIEINIKKHFSERIWVLIFSVITLLLLVFIYLFIKFKKNNMIKSLIFLMIILCSSIFLYFNFIKNNNKKNIQNKEIKKVSIEAKEKNIKNIKPSIIFLDNSFVDTFNKDETLEETSNMSESANPYWWLNSGAFFIQKNGIARTLFSALEKDSKWQLRYKNGKRDIPKETDNGYYPQNIFRLITKNKWQNFQQEAYFKINKYNLSESKNRSESNGLLLFSRYKDQYNLYYTGIRVDGTAVIKKKINKKYYTMAQEKIFDGEYNREINPNLLSINKWIGLKSEVKTINNNQVEIKVFVDMENNANWELVAEAIDDGKSYGGESILNESYAGIRTDFMDVEFDNFKIIKLEK